MYYLIPKLHAQDAEMLLMRHSGGHVSSLDMAQYVFWTGDEEGVARAVDEFIQKRLVNTYQLSDIAYIVFLIIAVSSIHLFQL